MTEFFWFFIKFKTFFFVLFSVIVKLICIFVFVEWIELACYLFFTFLKQGRRQSAINARNSNENVENSNANGNQSGSNAIPPRISEQLLRESELHQQNLDLFNDLVNIMISHLRSHSDEQFHQNEQPHMIANSNNYRHRMAVMIDLHMCKFTIDRVKIMIVLIIFFILC